MRSSAFEVLPNPDSFRRLDDLTIVDDTPVGISPVQMTIAGNSAFRLSGAVNGTLARADYLRSVADREQISTLMRDYSFRHPVMSPIDNMLMPALLEAYGGDVQTLQQERWADNLGDIPSTWQDVVTEAQSSLFVPELPSDDAMQKELTYWETAFLRAKQEQQQQAFLTLLDRQPTVQLAMDIDTQVRAMSETNRFRVAKAAGVIGGATAFYLSRHSPDAGVIMGSVTGGGILSYTGGYIVGTVVKPIRYVLGRGGAKRMVQSARSYTAALDKSAGTD